MSTGDITHVSFSDESHWNEGRYRSICLISLSKDDLECLENELQSIICRAGMNEFEWKRLKYRKHGQAAQAMCDFAVRYANTRRLRIDVLLWDMTDSRHDGGQVDDASNLGFMYYKLFRYVLRMRWPNDAQWELYPDQHCQIDWETVEECLDHASTQWDYEHPPLFNGTGSIRLWREFGIVDIHKAISQKMPLLQLADLFAGLAVFSHDEYPGYVEWQKANPIRPPLLQLQASSNETQPNNRSKARYSVLRYFNSLCKSHKLGVSLKGMQGLHTQDHRNPLNFWIYQPQHLADKAPQKVGTQITGL